MGVNMDDSCRAGFYHVDVLDGDALALVGIDVTESSDFDILGMR